MLRDQLPDESFREYLKVAMSQVKRTPYTLTQLREAGAAFGLRPSQMDLTTKVVRTLRMLPFIHEPRSTTISTPRTILDTTALSSLGAIIYWKFNELLVGEANTRVSMFSLYDQFSEAIPAIHAHLKGNPSLVADYPGIETHLLVPTRPIEDSTVALSQKPLNTVSFLETHSGTKAIMNRSLPPMAEVRARIIAEYNALFGDTDSHPV